MDSGISETSFINSIQTEVTNNIRKYTLADFEPIESASRVIVERVYRAADELRKNKAAHRPLTAGYRKPISRPSNSDPIDDEKSSVRLVEIGQYNVGCVFGLGEQMEDRVILAKTSVECLLIPRYWLFQGEQNLGNIWQK